MTDILNERADRIGTILLDRAAEWTPEDTVAQLSGETGYAARWYIYQLREAGYVIEAVKTVDPAAFTAGARGYRLSDIQSTPFRPADHVLPETSVEESRPVGITTGDKVDHPIYGLGTVTFAFEGAQKVVVRFKRNRIERVERETLEFIS